MWSAVVFDPARPFAQQAGQRLPAAVQEAEQRVVAEGLLPGGSGRLLLRVADHDRGVQVEHDPGPADTGRRRGRQPRAGLGRLRPGQFPGLRAGRPEPGQRRTVQIGQQPPRGRVGGHRTEQVRLVTQDRQVGDRLPTIGEHHREVHRDPARVMTGLPDPQRGERVTERGGQPGGIGQVGQQPGAGVPDDTPTVSGGNDLRTRPGNLHLESALRGGMDKDPQQVLSSQIRGHFHVPDPPPAATP